MNQLSPRGMLRFAATVAVITILLRALDPDPTTPRIVIYAAAAIAAALAPQWLPRTTRRTRA